METILYPTLARRKLMYGMPRDYFMLALVVTWLVTMVAFVVCVVGGWRPTVSLFVGLVTFLVLWPLGVLWAKKDPEFVTIYWTYWTQLGRTHSYGRHEGNRYHA